MGKLADLNYDVIFWKVGGKWLTLKIIDESYRAKRKTIEKLCLGKIYFYFCTIELLITC